MSAYIRNLRGNKVSRRDFSLFHSTTPLTCSLAASHADRRLQRPVRDATSRRSRRQELGQQAVRTRSGTAVARPGRVRRVDRETLDRSGRERPQPVRFRLLFLGERSEEPLPLCSFPKSFADLDFVSFAKGRRRIVQRRSSESRFRRTPFGPRQDVRVAPVRHDPPRGDDGTVRGRTRLRLGGETRRRARPPRPTPRRLVRRQEGRRRDVGTSRERSHGATERTREVRRQGTTDLDASGEVELAKDLCPGEHISPFHFSLVSLIWEKELS